MKRNHLLIAQSGLDELQQKSRVPALLDVGQGVTGLLLALFMWAHMLFVSSILFGEETMFAVTRMFEGQFFFGRSYPWLVSVVVFLVICLFVVHAWLAMRKLPASYREHRALTRHRATLRHSDTTLWFIQVYTGFVMFFLGSAHLFFMLMHPDQIGPYASADRVWGGAWPADLLLLLAVVLHGNVGLYRLAVKWGWFKNREPNATRRALRRATWVIIGVSLLVGCLSLATYMKIGYEHRDRAGERYAPEQHTLFTPRPADPALRPVRSAQPARARR